MLAPAPADLTDTTHERAYSSLLDFARWMAAWVVLLDHARLTLFPPYAALVRPSLALTGFLFVIMTGRAAVMIFFVLSGYLVGGALIRAPRGTPTLVRYASARFSRLYSVLLPAFALTALLAIVRYVSSGGLDPSILSRPYSLQTLALNLASLQGVWDRPYGGNYPLWSLTNEFWYYVAFPIGLYSVWAWSRRPVRAVAGVAFATALLAALSPSIAAYGVIWLLGVVVARVSWRPNLVASLAVCALSVAVARLWFSGAYFPIELLTGASFAAVLLAARRTAFAPRWLLRTARLNRWLAGFSFSLYAIHLPLLVFVSKYLGPLPLNPQSAQGVVTYVACVAGAIAAAFAFSLFTERQVGWLRTSLNARLLRWTPAAAEQGRLQTVPTSSGG